MMQLTPTVKAILIMNVVIFIMTYYFFPEGMLQFSLYDFHSSKFRPYQLFTHMFLHAGWGHLFGNMLSLFFFGPLLEYRWGGNRFLTFYLITGLGASLLYQGVRTIEFNDLEKDVAAYVAEPTPLNLSNFLDEHLPGQYDPQFIVEFKRRATDPAIIQGTIKSVKEIAQNLMENSKMLGASGAVFGILMAFGLLFPNTELMLLFFPVPIKAKYFVLLYGAYELYSGLARNPGDEVAHFAHLGGMLFAYILLKVWERDRKNFY